MKASSVSDTVDTIMNDIVKGKGGDATAKLAMGVGAAVFVADVTYRIAHSKVAIKLPSVSGMLDALVVTPWEVKKQGFGALSPLSVVNDFIGSILPKIDIGIGTGLWDWKITCGAIGLMVGGVMMYIANHPELVKSAIDRAQQFREDMQAAAKKIAENLSKSGQSASSIASALPAIMAVL